jgi:hypothetical protein
MNELEIKVMNYLNELGFSHSLSSFYYVTMIIAYCLENPADVYRLGKASKTCAEKAGSTTTRFERTLQHEIKTSMEPAIPRKEFVARAVNELRTTLATEEQHTGPNETIANFVRRNK